MPFRERLRKTFSRNSSSGASAASALSKTNTATTLDPRKNSSVYQPGEKMPPPKYRRPVEKKHKEHLEAFTFDKAWRRRSHQSTYSPMGSRIPSRAGSLLTAPSRSGSITTAGDKSLALLDVPPDHDDDVAARRTTTEDSEDSLNGASSSLESFRF